MPIMWCLAHPKIGEREVVAALLEHDQLMPLTETPVLLIAMHLARLLLLDEVVSVRVPTVQQESARDLVRAREDCRGDLMRARHRLSKLLLRRGIVYSGGQPWTGTQDVWLRGQSFEQHGVRLAFDADYEAVLLTAARRDRLDAAIEAMAADSEFTLWFGGCPAFGVFRC